MAGIGSVLALSVAGSQLVSNVPWVALQIPVLQAAGHGPATPVIWLARASGSTLAGALTLLGAASKLIIVEQSERAGVRLTPGRFVRVGAPLTAMTVTVVFVCLLVGL